MNAENCTLAKRGIFTLADHCYEIVPGTLAEASPWEKLSEFFGRSEPRLPPRIPVTAGRLFWQFRPKQLRQREHTPSHAL
jgi:hypothetical protein